MLVATTGLAVHVEPMRHDQRQLVLGARHGNVQQTALLLDLLGITCRHVGGNAAVDDVEHEYRLPLLALGGMDGRQDQVVLVEQRRAGERIAFVLLQLFRRARQLGLARGNTITLPMTQEHLADTIGFSLVHTNKTLKMLRRTGSFKWIGSTFELQDEEKLAAMVGPMAGIDDIRPFL